MIYHKEINQTNVSIPPTLIDVKWLKGTVAIVDNSIMSGIREELLKTNKRDEKVRHFAGETIEDMEDNIKLSLY